MNGEPGKDNFLSKSQYIRGRQCLKSLWLHRNQPEHRDEIGEVQQAIFSAGTDVGVLAQQYFPGGVFIPYEGISLSDQLKMTQEAINSGADVICEAAFCHDEVFFKADILRKVSEGWELYEVKASTAAKDVHLEDIALQCYVLSGAGIPIAGVYLIHVNNQYIRQGDIEVDKLFSVVDVSTHISDMQQEVSKSISAMRGMLQGDVPGIDIGPNCNDPYGCDFSGHCWQHIPSPSVFDFARIGKKAFELCNQGIVKMEDTPEDYLNDKQIMQLDSWRHQREYVDIPEVSRFLGSLRYPLCFMDFETFATPVPLYDGIKPYQQVPFQYSLHILDVVDGALTHLKYLAEGDVNPQQDFLESLLSAIPSNATVLVWNATFERQRLQELMQVFPLKKRQIQNILDNIVDLMVPFQKRHIYRPGFQGSYSIKNVLPYMVPDLSYKDLDIRDGSTASTEWLRMMIVTDPLERKTLREQLLAYCKMDTYAMVSILEEMKRIVQC